MAQSVAERVGDAILAVGGGKVEQTQVALAGLAFFECLEPIEGLTEDKLVAAIYANEGARLRMAKAIFADVWEASQRANSFRD